MDWLEEISILVLVSDQIFGCSIIGLRACFSCSLALFALSSRRRHGKSLACAACLSTDAALLERLRRNTVGTTSHKAHRLQLPSITTLTHLQHPQSYAHNERCRQKIIKWLSITNISHFIRQPWKINCQQKDKVTHCVPPFIKIINS